MATKVSDVAIPKRNRRHAKAKRRNLKTIIEVTAEAAAQGVQAPSNVGSLPEVMDEVLRRAVGHFRFAAAQVDKLPLDQAFTLSIDAQGNIVHKEHWWIQAERACREEVSDLALRMSGLDIDARRVAIAEAQAVLMTRALQSAIESIGLNPEQRRALGPALRQARAMLVGEQAEPDLTHPEGSVAPTPTPRQLASKPAPKATDTKAKPTPKANRA
jgi:hypothetical protein